MAQDYPPSTTTSTTAPPPVVCTGETAASGPLLPNASVTISATCPPLVDGDLVTGVLNSTPVALPVVRVGGDTASFPVRLPANWETNAFHTLTVTKASTGQLLFSDRFFVDCHGRITAGPTSGCGPARGGRNLPKTGADGTSDLAKAGVVLVAAGAGVALVARKRRRTATAEL